MIPDIGTFFAKFRWNRWTSCLTLRIVPEVRVVQTLQSKELSWPGAYLGTW
jgi:hypothetical protein